MAEEVTVRECHQYNKDTRAYVEAVEERHGADLKEIRNDIKALVDKMINRLPPWVTAVISILTLAVGVLASIAFR